MSVVAIVMNALRPEAVDAARRAVDWLRAAGHEVRLTPEDAATTGLDEYAWPAGDLATGAALAVSLGGDGTMLRTVSLVARSEAPVLGVNHGQLGYLTEVEPAQLAEALDRFFRGEAVLESRMLIEVTVERSQHPNVLRALALNEAVLERTVAGHTVRLDVAIGGEPFTPYEADGLIVATPTGSTAYAFSARGPIVSPTHRLLLLTPVSPHMLFDRTLVLEPDCELCLTVAGQRPALLTVDGRSLGELAPGDRVRAVAAEDPVQLVGFGPRDFLRIVKAKFGLNDRC